MSTFRDVKVSSIEYPYDPVKDPKKQFLAFMRDNGGRAYLKDVGGFRRLYLKGLDQSLASEPVEMPNEKKLFSDGIKKLIELGIWIVPWSTQNLALTSGMTIMSYNHGFRR